MAAHPAEFNDLASDPLFDIANHGTRHAPLSVTGRAAFDIRGTRSPAEVYTEIVENALDLQHRLGRPVTLFRPGTAYYDDVAVHIVRELAMTPVGFDVNADGGATFAPRQVESALRGVRPGSVVIAHMNQPHHGTAAGLRAALPRLTAAGYGFVHLRDHIPVQLGEGPADAPPDVRERPPCPRTGRRPFAHPAPQAVRHNFSTRLNRSSKGRPTTDHPQDRHARPSTDPIDHEAGGGRGSSTLLVTRPCILGVLSD